jgi:hypothetical protein
LRGVKTRVEPVNACGRLENGDQLGIARRWAMPSPHGSGPPSAAFRWLLPILILPVLLLSCQKNNLSAPTTALSHPQPIPNDPANWMGNRIQILGSKTLPQLTLPASHDSAMYESGFTASFGRTQNLSIYQQLAAGVRYFDFRPQCKSGKLFLHHGSILGPPLAEVSGDVQRFMQEGHRELLLLKFSHYEGINSESYREMIEQISQSLGPWLYRSLPPNHRLVDVPLNDYIRVTGKILILCDGQYPVENPTPGIWVYRDWNSRHPEQGDLRVYDSYSNSMSYETMKADQFAKFKSYHGQCANRPDVPCDLFLLSWTLTPPTDVPQFAKIADPHLNRDLAAIVIPNEFGKRVNLLYADCVDTWLTDVAISQN